MESCTWFLAYIFDLKIFLASHCILFEILELFIYIYIGRKRLSGWIFLMARLFVNKKWYTAVFYSIRGMTQWLIRMTYAKFHIVEYELIVLLQSQGFSSKSNQIDCELNDFFYHKNLFRSHGYITTYNIQFHFLHNLLKWQYLCTSMNLYKIDIRKYSLFVINIFLFDQKSFQTRIFHL